MNLLSILYLSLLICLSLIVHSVFFHQSISVCLAVVVSFVPVLIHSYISSCVMLHSWCVLCAMTRASFRHRKKLRGPSVISQSVAARNRFVSFNTHNAHQRKIDCCLKNWPAHVCTCDNYFFYQRGTPGGSKNKKIYKLFGSALYHFFTCAAPSVWNSLPASVIGSDSLSVFKCRLKTFLFRRSFN